MRFGKVIGRVVLSQHDSSLRSGRWLLVAPMGRREFADLSKAGMGDEPSLVVYDNLGAGEGDIIGFTEGGEAMLPFDPPMPVDATNAVIVDQIQFI
ncbi:MAG: ethanolamine utilization protein EutN [Opitutales bacterium]|nr:ethanolamine utilization protein EutN [Opitutales bacterium]